MIDFDDLDKAEETGEATTQEQQEAQAARAAEEPRRAAEEAERQRREPEEAEAERARAAAAEAEKPKRYWQVVRSIDPGGLNVQAGEAKTSPSVGRLPVGTVVLELDVGPNRRLRFERVDGDPNSASNGWVSTKGIGPWGKELLKCLGTYEEWQASVQEAPAQQQAPGDAGSMQQALILLDWDDTLCPTTFIRQGTELWMKHEADDSPARAQLEAQAQAALQVLRKAASLGSVAVVTLAERAWIKVACRQYVPALAEEIAGLDVFYAGEQKVLELRAGATMLDFCTMQKKRAMEEALGILSDRLGPRTAWRSLVSIGDSEAEINAAKDLGRESRATGQVTWTKTVKLRDHPDLAQLTDQLRTLDQMLPDLVASEGSRSIELSGGGSAW